MRLIIGFLLGVAVASTIIYSRTMQWLPDYLSSRYADYANAPPPVVAPEVVAPPSNYPQVPPAYPNAAAPAYPAAPSPGYPGTSDSLYPGASNSGYPGASDDGAPSSAPNTVAPPQEIAPPYGVPQPFKIQVSLDARGAGGIAGCFSAYTVLNETSRPIVLANGRRRDNSEYRERRGDELVVQPGRREVACTDVTRDRPYSDNRRLDYTNPYPDPDARDEEVTAPTVNIRIVE